MFVNAIQRFVLIVLLIPLKVAAQQNTSLSVDVEIIAPSLTLSVSSARLNFGQVSQNADAVEIHPESGARSGEAYGAYSLAGILLTGTPGMQVTLHVSSPVFSTEPSAQPIFQHTWAHSQDCTQSDFTLLPTTSVLRAEIGDSGCTHIQMGGTLSVNQSAQGRYSGEITVQVTQL